MSIRPHYKLQAWSVSMELVKIIYQWSAIFPPEEKFGLQSQMRRAAVSVPSNIAEGAARSGSKEFAYFLSVARGSLSELETQYLIATQLGIAEQNTQLEEHIEQASRLITGLHKRHTTQNKS